MRPLVVGLLGVVLGVGAAQAGECKPDGLVLTANASQQGSESTFKVVRVASAVRPADTQSPPRYDAKGWTYLILANENGRFFVEQPYDPRLTATDYDKSFPADSTEAKRVDWGHRDRNAERLMFVATLDIQSGPLSGLRLTPTDPTRCR